MSLRMEYIESTMGYKRYTVDSKIKAVKYALGTSVKRDVVASELGIGVATLTVWISDYRKGVLCTGNAMTIRRKEVKVLDIVTAEMKKTQTAITRLENKLSELRAKAKMVLEEEYKKQLEALG